MLGLLIVGAIVIVWLLFEVLVSRGIDEIFDGVSNLFRSRKDRRESSRPSKYVIREADRD